MYIRFRFGSDGRAVQKKQLMLMQLTQHVTNRPPTTIDSFIMDSYSPEAVQELLQVDSEALRAM